MLVLDRRQLVDAPSDVADDVAELSRRLLTNPSGYPAGGDGESVGA